MTIIFENPGVIDARAIWTFGVNVKETENPVGYFGTGLKYAIAVLLRVGCSVTIHAGEQTHRFSLAPFDMRGKRFDAITMDDRELGFTTELGKNWEPWMAYRELHCNARDEDGRTYQLAEEQMLPALDGCTQIVVSGDAIESAHLMRNTFLLEGRAPRLTIPGKLEIYDGVSDHIFYRGIRAGSVPVGKRSRFTYNLIEQATLTEDRTLASGYDVVAVAERAIANSADAAFIEACVTEKSEDMMEAKMDFMFVYNTPSPTYFAVINELKRTRLTDLRDDAIKLFTKHVAKELAPAGRSLTAIESAILAKAKDFVRSIGFPCEGHEIRVAETLGTGTLAVAMMRENRIVLSAELFRQGVRMVALGLVEEHLHLITGAADGSRALQTRLMHEIIRLGEELAGTALDETAFQIAAE
jgi:hypothetical protein